MLEENTACPTGTCKAASHRCFLGGFDWLTATVFCFFLYDSSGGSRFAPSVPKAFFDLFTTDWVLH